MSEGQAPTTVAKPAVDELSSSKATETLSQFVARVLNQLSLSAWLPSAALVLSLDFVFNLGAVLDRVTPPGNAWSAMTAAFRAMTEVNIGGSLLLFVAVVVLTIFTQAFSFEAIRFLEGYWGVRGPAGWFARWRCRHFEKRAETLRTTQTKLTKLAWREARVAIERSQAAVTNAGSDDETRSWTPDMLNFLGAMLAEQEPTVNLGKPEIAQALHIPWQRYASPDYFRRLVVIDKKLRDFPKTGRGLPTRFGNVMRASEDQIHRSHVETAVLDVYDTLPLALRLLHDDHRNRLDLYASMVFVELLVTAVAVIRVVPQHWEFGLAAVVAGLGACWLTYRAAVAAARTYGVILVNITQRFQSSS